MTTWLGVLWLVVMLGTPSWVPLIIGGTSPETCAGLFNKLCVTEHYEKGWAFPPFEEQVHPSKALHGAQMDLIPWY
jgi:hypothetical protein